MAYSKKDQFADEDISISEIAKALSHPARIQILRILTRMNLCMCGDIVELLPLSQSTVSQHLKELKRVGLIKGEIDGPKVCYCVDSEKMMKAKTDIESLLN
jgi:DNA-binding transcriptional ArsR family regulator